MFESHLSKLDVAHEAMGSPVASLVSRYYGHGAGTRRPVDIATLERLLDSDRSASELEQEREVLPASEQRLVVLGCGASSANSRSSSTTAGARRRSGPSATATCSSYADDFSRSSARPIPTSPSSSTSTSADSWRNGWSEWS